MKKLLQFLFHRIVVIVVLMLVQLLLIVSMIVRFSEYFVFFYAFSTLLSGVIILHILNGRSNPAYKLAWVIPVLLLPVFGGPLYLLFGKVRLEPKELAREQAIRAKSRAALAGDSRLDNLAAESLAAGAQSRYIQGTTLLPPYTNTSTLFLPQGENKFEHMKRELELAERYIFLEYFIIQEGAMWDALLEILVRKAAQGVDVRVLYDDAGCMFTLPYRYNRKLESLGIKCSVFNPFTPVLSSKFNNRNHRKIAVIDGKVGFTGGINLADEYINAVVKYGHWKDTAVLLKGDAVWGLTVLFLSMWDSVRGEGRDYSTYRPPIETVPGAAGYVQPYADNPNSDEGVSENICLGLISRAERYIYITTPYLVVDNELMTALTAAAKSGIDVRIITPHIPDKWYVFAVTQANYQQLIESGVKIYEYTPGFIHAKTFLVDDKYATVGTVNLDYRSLYLHFECGVWLCGAEAVAQARRDLEATLRLCQQITLEQCKAVAWYRKLGWSLLRVFAPLM